MGVETFNLIASITLIIMAVTALVILFLVVRVALKVNRFIGNVERRVEKLYAQVMNIERKAAVGVWFWPRFIRSVISSDFVRSVFRGPADREGRL